MPSMLRLAALALLAVAAAPLAALAQDAGSPLGPVSTRYGTLIQDTFGDPNDCEPATGEDKTCLGVECRYTIMYIMYDFTIRLAVRCHACP